MLFINSISDLSLETLCGNFVQTVQCIHVTKKVQGWTWIKVSEFNTLFCPDLHSFWVFPPFLPVHLSGKVFDYPYVLNVWVICHNSLWGSLGFLWLEIHMRKRDISVTILFLSETMCSSHWFQISYRGSLINGLCLQYCGTDCVHMYISQV